MLLFTVIVRDRHGHGMPIVWMITSNGQADTIDYFLMYLHQLNPNIIPNKFMSDNDSGQLGWIRFRYSLSQLMLCWWDVLHAWQQHFITRHYLEFGRNSRDGFESRTKPSSGPAGKKSSLWHQTV
jgi:hypothetical protein